MAAKDKGSGRSSGMKTAYELALERLESQGIERPREEALSAEIKEKIADARRKAEAQLAELEILHRDRLKTLPDPVAREKEKEEYSDERRRIEQARDGEIRQLRSSSS